MCAAPSSTALRTLLVGMLVALGALSSPAIALEPIAIRAGVDQASLASYVEVIEDPSGRLSIEDIRQGRGGVFRAARNQVLRFAPTRSAYWLRFAVTNPGTQRAHRLVELAYPSLDYVDFYTPDARTASGWRVLETGDNRAFDSRGIDHRNFVFPIDMPPGATTTYYIRVASTSALHFPLTLWTQDQFRATTQTTNLWLGISFGVILAMLIYNLLLAVALRDSLFLVYVAFAASFGLFNFAINGFAYQWLYPDHPRLGNLGLYLFLCASILFASQFSRMFLSTRALFPAVDRALKVLMLLAVVLAAAFLMGSNRMVVWLGQFIGVAAALVAVFGGILAWRRGYKPARLYLAAFALVSVAGVASVARNMGWLPADMLTMYGMQIGAAIEVLLWALALADRINALKRENDMAFASIRHSEVNLERRVQLKTSELARTNEELRIEIEERRRTEDRLRLSEERMRTLAHYDPLTGAANRNLFRELLTAALDRARRTNNHVGVVLVDLDRFKVVNDTFGHDAGDKLLVTVSRRLQESLRGSDVVARMGGDEFVLLIDDLKHRDDVLPILAKLRAQFDDPIIHGSTEFKACASLGCALFPNDGRDADALMKDADLSMYKEKRSRRPVVMLHAVAS